MNLRYQVKKDNFSLLGKWYRKHR